MQADLRKLGVNLQKERGPDRIRNSEMEETDGYDSLPRTTDSAGERARTTQDKPASRRINTPHREDYNPSIDRRNYRPPRKGVLREEVPSEPVIHSSFGRQTARFEEPYEDYGNDSGPSETLKRTTEKNQEALRYIAQNKNKQKNRLEMGAEPSVHALNPSTSSPITILPPTPAPVPSMFRMAASQLANGTEPVHEDPRGYDAPVVTDNLNKRREVKGRRGSSQYTKPYVV